MRVRLYVRLFGAAIYRLRHVFSFPCLALNFCSRRGRVRFRAFASIPGRVYARSRSPGSSTRLSAVIHLCAGRGVSRAAWLGSARTGQFRRVGSLEWKLRARDRPRGPAEGPYPRLSGISALPAPRDKTSPIAGMEFCHERVLGRALTRAEGAFGRPPQT